jgi:hypothetical protein
MMPVSHGVLRIQMVTHSGDLALQAVPDNLSLSISLSLSLSLWHTAARMDRHLLELDSHAAISNNIVHLYKPVETEDEEPVQQQLATAGVPLMHMYPLSVCV